MEKELNLVGRRWERAKNTRGGRGRMHQICLNCLCLLLDHDNWQGHTRPIQHDTQTRNFLTPHPIHTHTRTHTHTHILASIHQARGHLWPRSQWTECILPDTKPCRPVRVMVVCVCVCVCVCPYIQMTSYWIDKSRQTNQH